METESTQPWDAMSSDILGSTLDIAASLDPYISPLIESTPTVVPVPVASIAPVIPTASLSKSSEAIAAQPKNTLKKTYGYLCVIQKSTQTIDPRYTLPLLVKRIIDGEKRLFSIGSAKDNDITVKNDLVAPKHISIVLSNDKMALRNHAVQDASFTPILINGAAMTQEVVDIADGDRFAVASRTFLICFEKPVIPNAGAPAVVPTKTATVSNNNNNNNNNKKIVETSAETSLTEHSSTGKTASLHSLKSKKSEEKPHVAQEPPVQEKSKKIPAPKKEKAAPAPKKKITKKEQALSELDEELACEGESASSQRVSTKKSKKRQVVDNDQEEQAEETSSQDTRSSLSSSTSSKKNPVVEEDVDIESVDEHEESSSQETTVVPEKKNKKNKKQTVAASKKSTKSSSKGRKQSVASTSWDSIDGEQQYQDVLLVLNKADDRWLTKSKMIDLLRKHCNAKGKAANLVSALEAVIRDHSDAFVIDKKTQKVSLATSGEVSEEDSSQEHVAEEDSSVEHSKNSQEDSEEEEEPSDIVDDDEIEEEEKKTHSESEDEEVIQDENSDNESDLKDQPAQVATPNKHVKHREIKSAPKVAVKSFQSRKKKAQKEKNVTVDHSDKENDNVQHHNDNHQNGANDDGETPQYCMQCGFLDPPNTTIDQWVGCDGCDKWFHQRCVPALKKRSIQSIQSGTWYCNECKEKYVVKKTKKQIPKAKSEESDSNVDMSEEERLQRQTYIRNTMRDPTKFGIKGKTRSQQKEIQVETLRPAIKDILKKNGGTMTARDIRNVLITDYDGCSLVDVKQVLEILDNSKTFRLMSGQKYSLALKKKSVY